MPYEVFFDDAFAAEFRSLDVPVRTAILKGVGALRIEGHRLGRPWVDTLKGSRHANMKELRITADKREWRVAFAFDPERQAILLAAIAKGGKSEARLCPPHLAGRRALRRSPLPSSGMNNEGAAHARTP